MVWGGVVEVALAGGAAASGEGAGLLPDFDQVLQSCWWPVGGGVPRVGAPGALEPLQVHSRQQGGDVRVPFRWWHRGGRRWRRFVSRWSGFLRGWRRFVSRWCGCLAGWCGSLCWWCGCLAGWCGCLAGWCGCPLRWCRCLPGWRWALLRGWWPGAGRWPGQAVSWAGAAVADGVAVLAGQGDAAAALRVCGDGRGEVAAVAGGQRAEPGDLTRCVREAEPGAQRHGQVDHPRHRRDTRPAGGSQSATGDRRSRPYRGRRPCRGGQVRRGGRRPR